MSVSPKLISAPPATTAPYLWVVGDHINGQAIAQLSPGTVVGDRFQVIAAHVWQDTQGEVPLEREIELPTAASPYLKLYAQRLHVPDVYGLYTPSHGDTPIILLDNVPVDSSGTLLPTISVGWQNASPVRQLSWLWQMGQLWPLLTAQGVATSLLTPDNIHVDGWRIRLRELLSDSSHHTAEHNAFGRHASGNEHTTPRPSPSLQDLGTTWMDWAATAHPSIRETIQTIAHDLQQPGAQWATIAPALNQALLQQASLSPLHLDIAGATFAGTGRSLNEDSCYPITLSVNGTDLDEADELQPRVAIICDGICGHAGGEVASRLTIRALKLQLRALFADLASEDIPLSPHIVMRQLETAIRVVNNLVAFQNNEQSRQDRQRMGTTLVMAVQIPQTIGTANTHELYIAHVGDSRAYWLTPERCHPLTVDDDVKSREVIGERSLPREAARRTDAIALTQALGTRSGDYLHLTLQRFIIDEDGVLLLCSDGLSDGGLVERYWKSMANNVLNGKLDLNKAAGIWLKLADQHNGHDNASVALMRCRTSESAVNLFEPSTSPTVTSQQTHLDSPDGQNRRSVEPTSTVMQSSASLTQDVYPSMEDQGIDFSDASFSTMQSSEFEASFSQESFLSSSGSSEEFEALARTLLEPEVVPSSTVNHEEEEESGWGVFAVAVGLAIVMFIVGAGGVFAWRRYAPVTFNDTLEQAVDTFSKYLKLTDSPAETQD
ncbi:MAG: serine/threonine-protein phosphatase [Cyanobacteria bacterium P01_E01_bin.6]